MQSAVDGQGPARDCEDPVSWDGEAPGVLRVRHGAGAIWWKCLLPLCEVCDIVWVEIWPRKDLREVGCVVGPAPYHTVMRGQDFLRDLRHVFDPMNVMSLTSRRTDSCLHDAPPPVSFRKRVRTQEKCIYDLPTPILTLKLSAIPRRISSYASEKTRTSPCGIRKPRFSE